MKLKMQFRNLDGYEEFVYIGTLIFYCSLYSLMVIDYVNNGIVSDVMHRLLAILIPVYIITFFIYIKVWFDDEESEGE